MDADYVLSDAQLLARCRQDFFRAQGPGGQHTNRTESAVRLTHVPTQISLQCQAHRERARNVADALWRLRIRLACTLRGLSDPAWITPWVKGSRIIIGPNAAAYPQVVAVLLDALLTHSGALALTADELGISSSQITKCLTADKEVHMAANKLREQFSLGALHG
jgi:RF-1 domain